MHDDPAILQDLPRLADVQIVEVLDVYDGPLDGLASYRGCEHWFSAVPEWVLRAEPSQPRTFVLHELTAGQAARVRAEARQFAAFAGGAGDASAWGSAWDGRSTFDEAPTVGWFSEPPVEGR